MSGDPGLEVGALSQAVSTGLSNWTAFSVNFQPRRQCATFAGRDKTVVQDGSLANRQQTPLRQLINALPENGTNYIRCVFPSGSA